MTDWNSVANNILKMVLTEWKLQGHAMTNTVESRARSIVEHTVNSIKIIGELEYYTKFVNEGVAAEKIRFYPPTGRGGTSKYIEGLIKFAQARGMEKPVSAAFAIATTQKLEGMPTHNSTKYSSTGKRTEFIEDTFQKLNTELSKLIFDASVYEIEKELKIFIPDYEFTTTIEV